MRITVFGAAALWLAPVLSVGVLGLGLPRPAAIAIGTLVAALVAWFGSRPVAALIAPALAGRKWLAAAALVIALAAIIQIGRLSVFTADSIRTGYSGMPDDPWRVRHCCMTGYAEAARFAQQGGVNIYDHALYQPRQIGPLQVDRYHYPPPFLLPLRAMRFVTGDFFRLRMLWFAAQAAVLLMAVVWIALWIGGTTGSFALLGGALVLAAPTVVYSLQMGNFQSTAVALSSVGLALVCANRTNQMSRGAPLLAFVSVSKIFPGILFVYLLAARRWRAAGWIAGSGLVLVILSLAVLGTRPFVDFVGYAVPEISDGRAFPQSERPQTASANTSVYGLTVRVRLLGAQALDQLTGLKIASLYGLLVIALAGVAGWKIRPDLTTADGRAVLTQVGLALVSLASFRSPFVGGPYGYVATFWLLILLASTSQTARARAFWIGGLFVMGAGNWLTPSPHFPVSRFWLAASGVLVLVAIAINLLTILRAVRIRPGALPIAHTLPRVAGV